MARGLDRRRRRPVDRAAEPAPARSGDRRSIDRPDGAPQDVHRAARVLDRRRAPGLGDPARPGRRGQPGPDRRLDRRRVGAVESSPVEGVDRRPVAARRPSPVPAPIHRPRSVRRVIRGIVVRSRAAQQVGRRAGAHRRPRPGRASGSRRFTGPQPARTSPGQRIPAALGPRRTARGRRSRSIRSTLPTVGRRARRGRRRSSSPARRRRPARPARADARPARPRSALRVASRRATRSPGPPRSTTTARPRCACRAARS